MKEKAQQRDAESRKNYRGYDWETMFCDGSLSKLKAVELDKYLTHHNLRKHPTKKAKLETINKKIQELSWQVEEDEEDYVLRDSEDDSDNDSGEDSEEDCESVEMPAIAQTSVVYTRSGRRATQFRL